MYIMQDAVCKDAYFDILEGSLPKTASPVSAVRSAVEAKAQGA